jgi:hypothetical protein
MSEYESYTVFEMYGTHFLSVFGSKSGHYSDTKFPTPPFARRTSLGIATPPHLHRTPTPRPCTNACGRARAVRYHTRQPAPAPSWPRATHTIATTQQTVWNPPRSPALQLHSMFRLLCLASLALLTHCEEKKLAPCPYETLYKKSKTVPGAEVVTFGEPPNTPLALSDNLLRRPETSRLLRLTYITRIWTSSHARLLGRGTTRNPRQTRVWV